MLEAVCRSLNNKRFVNPGLLNGPYLILYGAGALILKKTIFILNVWASAPLLKFLVYFSILTCLELVSAYIAQYLFRRRLWDYSEQRFNYKGYICFKFSVYWAVLALAFEYLILTPYQGFQDRLSPIFMGIFTGVTFFIMLLDFFVVCIENILILSLDEKDDLEREFLDVSEPLLKNPSIAALSQYKHHRDKTRLNHVIEVSHT